MSVFVRIQLKQALVGEKRLQKGLVVRPRVMTTYKESEEAVDGRKECCPDTLAREPAIVTPDVDWMTLEKLAPRQLLYPHADQRAWRRCC